MLYKVFCFQLYSYFKKKAENSLISFSLGGSEVSLYLNGLQWTNREW